MGLVFAKQELLITKENVKHAKQTTFTTQKRRDASVIRKDFRKKEIASYVLPIKLTINEQVNASAEKIHKRLRQALASVAHPNPSTAKEPVIVSLTIISPKMGNVKNARKTQTIQLASKTLITSISQGNWKEVKSDLSSSKLLIFDILFIQRFLQQNYRTIKWNTTMFFFIFFMGSENAYIV